MKKVIGLAAMMASTAALVAPSSSFAQQRCGREVCTTTFDCVEVPVVCGQNEDGTAIVCIEIVCDPITVCEQPPCTATPVPEILEEFDVPEDFPIPTFPPGDPLPF
jgi:hypothetical protein